MALYKFKVSDASGKISELLVEGDSQADATRKNSSLLSIALRNTESAVFFSPRAPNANAAAYRTLSN